MSVTQRYAQQTWRQVLFTSMFWHTIIIQNMNQIVKYLVEAALWVCISCWWTRRSNCNCLRHLKIASEILGKMSITQFISKLEMSVTQFWDVHNVDLLEHGIEKLNRYYVWFVIKFTSYLKFIHKEDVLVYDYLQTQLD